MRFRVAGYWPGRAVRSVWSIQCASDHRKLFLMAATLGAPCRPCQVAVGTPGRLCALVESGALPTRDVRLLVLDEADGLWADSFRRDVQWLAGALPRQKQACPRVTARFS